ncbi:MAG: serine/threonine protein kinase [Proteobacteria bacterium]|nr:serine/threonine protein kinase [Pseudomonadota bacterium]
MEGLPNGFVLREQFRVLSTIGRGATSHVYLAKDQRYGHLCAIKAIVVETAAPNDPFATTDTILSEARLLTSLSHSGLPKVYDFFFLNNLYYLVMEWVAGQTLLQVLIDKGAPCAEAEVLAWGIELCDILSYLHQRRPNPVVVGDIKPNNIMRTYEGKLKLIDFGIARYADAAVKADGHTFVTPGFSPPEQYRKVGLDRKADIYALGATLYYLLTAANLDRFRFQVPPLRDLAPTCTRQFEEALERCLQNEASARYASVDQLKEDLRKAQDVDRRRDNNVNKQAKDILASLYRSKKDRRDL